MTRKRRFSLDPVEGLDAAAALPGSCEFAAADRREARAWQRRTRKALAGCIGFPDQERVSLEPAIVETVDRGAYLQQKVIIRTTKHSHMPVYVLIPKDAPRPLPCVLAFHGHGYGVKDIVGLWEDGRLREKPDGYHADFACELAGRGFLVAAPEISCFGERTTKNASFDMLLGNDPLRRTCYKVSTYAMMRGWSAMGMRVWDGFRAVDYLGTRTEADVSRLGAMGISGGGAHSFFSTALDERIKACVISGYFCDWRRGILATPHCLCNFVPGILKLGELSDLAGLIAPRPCLVENGTRDDIFPINSVRGTVRRARRAWRVFGSEELLATDYFEGRHRIGGAKAYDFLAEYLG